MDLQPVDFVSGLGPLPDALKAMQEGQAGKLALQGASLHNQAQAEALVEHQRSVQRQAGFGAAFRDYLTHPTTTGLVSLFGDYPEFHDQLKEAHSALDEDQQRVNTTQLGSVAALAAKGDYKGAADILQRRIDADKAAGHDTSDDQEILDHLNDPDPAKQKGALALTTIALAGAVGPDKAAAFLKANGLSQEPIIRSPEVGTDVVSIDPTTGETRTLYRNPYVKGADGTIYERESGGQPGGTAISPGTSPAAASVAATLSSAGLPAPVVAGFMGNFHVEGGYDGAHGDGGSASGIGQWHAERGANFERVIGKTVDQASPAEQAKFVLWEMQNPEAAGMTAAQRDKILAAKTPAQAAALIDQYYERSDGKARQGRMAAATAFAGGGSPATTSATAAPAGLRVVVPGKQREAPAGYRFKADGSLEPIPGGPAEKRDPPAGYRWKKDGSLQAIPGGPADAAVLDPATLSTMAEQYLAGDKSVLQNLGRGTQGAANIVRLRTEIARQMKEQGKGGRDVAATMAEYSGLVAGERTLGQRTANIEMAGTEFQKIAPLALRASRAASRSGFVPLAKAQQMIQSGTNDPNLRRFVAANTSVVNVYARAISPTGAPHVADQEHARAMLSTAFDAPSYAAVIDQLQQEIAAARQAPGTVRGEFRGAITGQANPQGFRIIARRPAK
jgi:hypothetical protein